MQLYRDAPVLPQKRRTIVAIGCLRGVQLPEPVGREHLGKRGRLELLELVQVKQERPAHWCGHVSARERGAIDERDEQAADKARVIRPDIYLEAMKELGVKVNVAEEQKVTLFDGVFDGKDPEKYAKSFPINSLVG